MSRKPFHLLVVFALLAVVRSPAQQLGSEVIERGPHHKVVRTTRLVTNELGEVSVRAGQYTALGDGMHYRAIEGDDTSPWIESEALVEPHPEGAIAQRTPLKTLFQRNIAHPQ